MHTGTFSLSRRHRGTVLAENVIGALVLTTGLSLALAVGAWLLVTVALAGPPDPPVRPGADLDRRRAAGLDRRPGRHRRACTIAAARRAWDLDNLVAPVVATLGDVLTLPALWLATHLLDHGTATTLTGWAVVVGASRSVSTAWPAGRTLLAHGVPPVLARARRRRWPEPARRARHRAPADRLPGRADALLVLVPAFVSSAGAFGGVLSARVATGLHLGTRRATLWPDRGTRADVTALGGLALPVMALQRGRGMGRVGSRSGPPPRAWPTSWPPRSSPASAP